jgi:hypothetical protein
MKQTQWMLHVWSVPGYRSADGVFAETNRRLDCPDGTFYELPPDQVPSRRSSRQCGPQNSNVRCHVPVSGTSHRTFGGGLQRARPPLGASFVLAPTPAVRPLPAPIRCLYVVLASASLNAAEPARGRSP